MMNAMRTTMGNLDIRRWRPIALLVGGAMICSSLVMTADTTAAAQGLEAGEGLRQAVERDRQEAEQKKVKERDTRAAARENKAKQRTITKSAERAVAQLSRDAAKRRTRLTKSAEGAADQIAREAAKRRAQGIGRAGHVFGGTRRAGQHITQGYRAGSVVRRSFGHFGMAYGGFHRTAARSGRRH